MSRAAGWARYGFFTIRGMRPQGDSDLAEGAGQREGAEALGPRLVRPRLAIDLVLAVAALVWALVRGLHFYGVSPVHVVYDLDQPPWLLLLVSGWLAYRSRAR